MKMATSAMSDALLQWGGKLSGRTGSLHDDAARSAPGSLETCELAPGRAANVEFAPGRTANLEFAPGRTANLEFAPGRTAWACKRVADYLLALAALVAFAPFALVVALAIKVESPGPVFFRQVRVGRGGRTFRMWKFRSMVTGAEAMLPGLAASNEARGPFFKMSADPRVTRVGSVLRRTCLDEVPQLLNVLAGQMSLVGPRPFLPSEMSEAPELFRWRLPTLPGITGLWQVAGSWWLDPEEGRQIDRAYLERWSLWFDMRIALRTVSRAVALWRHPGRPKPSGEAVHALAGGGSLSLQPEPGREVLPDVSVVIVTHDSADDIGACLAAVRGEAAACSLEVVVVDNASRDASADVAAEAYPKARVVRSARRQGFAANANLGARLALGEVIVLLNPDARLRKGALATLIEVLDAHPEVGICGPRLVYPDGSDQHSARRFPTGWVSLVRRTPLRWAFPGGFEGERRHMMEADHLARLKRPCSVDWVLGAAMAVRRQVWDDLGGLDEGYRLYCEDIDLCRRAWDAGYAVAYVPDALAEHDLGALTSKRFLTRATIWHFRSMARFLRLHGLGRPAFAPESPRLLHAPARTGEEGTISAPGAGFGVPSADGTPHAADDAPLEEVEAAG